MKDENRPMQPISISERTALAEKLLRLKKAIAEPVTDEFLQNHPDWLERYGERGRKHGVEDACFHIEFLAGAIEGGAPAPFEDYTRWTVHMLATRQIPAHFVAENLGQIDRALRSKLSNSEQLLVSSFIRSACEACTEAPTRAPAHEDPSGLALSQRLFLQAILKGQRKAAVSIVSEALREAYPVLDIYVEVFQGSLYQVGRLWEANEITVAEEHMATAITQYVIAHTYSHLPTPSVRRGNAILTGVSGEFHQVGANMVADVLASEGYDVRFLGTNMPHGGILEEIEKHHANLLGISATMLFNIPQVIRLVADVNARFGTRAPRIVLGGAAFHGLPSLSAELGVVGVAGDLRAAVRLALGQDQPIIAGALPTANNYP